jgi:hypothetical protein
MTTWEYALAAVLSLAGLCAGVISVYVLVYAVTSAIAQAWFGTRLSYYRELNKVLKSPDHKE